MNWDSKNLSGKFILPELPAVSLESTCDLERETEWTKVMLNSWKPSLCGRHHGSYTWDKTYFIQDFLMLCYLDFVHLFVSSFSYFIFTHFIRATGWGQISQSRLEVKGRLIWIQTKLRRCLPFGTVIIPCLEFWPCNV